MICLCSPRGVDIVTIDPAAFTDHKSIFIITIERNWAEAIWMSKTVAKNKRAKMQAIIQGFGALCDKTDLTEEQAQNLRKLQENLNRHYEEKAKSAFIINWLKQVNKHKIFFIL